ncbi:Arc family DNA-binding protein [Bradyrhizobium sp. CCBAU 45321]|uniref:Arc family DNA-binding protein n=1 Tax=Bradyrhizobium sp. CCBAU 45321 TaxID=1641878 RepID=UPI002FE1F09B
MQRPKQKMQGSTGRDSEKFILRMPAGMRDRIAKMAAQNGRSMNSEIIAALEKYVEATDSISLLWDAIDELQKQIDDIHESRGDLNRD